MCINRLCNDYKQSKDILYSIENKILIGCKYLKGCLICCQKLTKKMWPTITDKYERGGNQLCCLTAVDLLEKLSCSLKKVEKLSI